MKKALFLMAAVGLLGAGCERRDHDHSILERRDGPAERLGEDVDKAAKDVEDKVEDATDHDHRR